MDKPYSLWIRKEVLDGCDCWGRNEWTTLYICPKCHCRAEQESTFCPECGKKLLLKRKPKTAA